MRTGLWVVRSSAGILLWRHGREGVEVLLVHPGGPYWRARDEGAWSIPKGEIGAGEDPLDAARREFAEETGTAVEGPFADLGTCRLASGKRIRAFAAKGDLDAEAIVSNTMTIEWPPRSGRIQSFPEVDRAAWCTPRVARRKLIAPQRAFLDALAALLAQAPRPGSVPK